MQPSLRCPTRLAVVATFGLSLFAAACSVNSAVFTGIDANTLPGTASLTVSRNGTSTGTVSSNPGGIACGSSCSAALPLGTMVTLTAIPDPGAELTGWSGGGCTGSTPTCMVTVDGATTVTASFDIARYPVTINVGGSGTGMAVALSAGITCPGSCTAMIPHGSQLSLTASSGAGSQFMGWTVAPGGTACAGTDACSTTITGPTTITATFARFQSLEVTRSGTGRGTVTSNPTGIDCGADCSETYPPGARVTLTATAADDSTFTGWSGGGCSGTGSCSVDVNGATMVTAELTLRPYDLTVTKAGLGAGTVLSTPAGIDCGATCTATYDAGTQVTLTASPAVGTLFAGWSGEGCTGTSTCVVTLAAAATVTATFDPILHTLTVLRAGTGAGTVTSSPDGIDCGTDCTEDYAEGALVTLTATPSADSTFTGWSGGCTGTGACTVAMAAAVTVTASFSVVQHTLTVGRNGTGAGSVSSAPAGITCGADCTEDYPVGTGVTLTAVASAGSTFAGWSGGACTGNGTCVVTMNAATTITATFTLNTYALTTSISGTGTGTIASTPAGITCGSDCTESFDHGIVVTLTAMPAVGSTFGGWGGACTGTGSCVVTMTAAASVSAIFTANQYMVTVTTTGAGTVTSLPDGINCGTDCAETVDHGTLMTLTAAPATGSTFGGWTGGGCSGTGTCVITVTAATAVTASFTLAPFALTVTRPCNGTGTVTSSPGGITCGTDCTESYLHGTAVTLTAAAGIDSIFTGWTAGGCVGTGTCTVAITGATTVPACFVLKTYPVTAVIAGTGAGTVTSLPDGISCGADCSETVNHGTTMALTASPSVGSTFSGWSGGGCAGTGACVVTITAATTVTATFTLNTYVLTVTKPGTGDGTVTSTPTGINCGADCSEVMGHGTSVVLTALPSVGSTFTGWSGGGCTGTGTCSVAMTAATAVTARFTLNTYTLTVAKGGTGAGTVTSLPGIDCGSDCTEVVGHGTVMALTASPAVGSTFTGWSGGGCTGTGACAATVTGTTTVTATFTLNRYTLTVAKGGTGAGTVTSTPAGIDCGTTCSATFDHGTTVTLTASPSVGSTFTSWSGGGCTGNGTCTVTMAAATTVTASFTPNTYQLSVTIGAGTGTGSVSSAPAGITCGTDCSEVYSHGTTVVLTATPSPNSTFSGWTGACTGTGTWTVVMTAATVVTATFAIATYPFTVICSGSGSGSVTSSPAGISCGTNRIVNHGTAITLTASPSFGSTFTGWIGGGCSGTGPCTLTVTSPSTVTVMFTLNKYTLSVTKNGTGSSSGTVTSSPSGINCGFICSATFDHGTPVVLTASAPFGSTFGGWSGGGCSGTGTCTVTMTAATAVTATFTVNTYPLSVNKAGNGSGAVTSSPLGINCSPTCSATFDHGTPVVLTASPSVGSTFTGWSGGGCGGTGTCTVTMTAATSVTATFTLNTYPLSVTKNGNGNGSVTSSPPGITCPTDCSEVFNHGTQVTLTASSPADSTFSGWIGGGCGGTGTCTVTMTSVTSVTATFTLNTYTLSVNKVGTSGTVTSSPTGISCGGTCAASYNHGTPVTLTATPGAGSTFTGWSGAGCSSTGLCAVTMTAATSVTATFTLTCGNGVCSGGETCSNCPSDCGNCVVCDDGVCNGGETCTSCPSDCGNCCGDGTCSGVELNSCSCVEDCGCQRNNCPC
jgi:Divergent InlB B-repeat domain